MHVAGARRRRYRLNGTPWAPLSQDLMPSKPEPKQHSWLIYRIRGTPAAFVGHVEAPDEQTAIKKAFEELKITDPDQQRRLVAKRST
jgi:hypothetical protein